MKSPRQLLLARHADAQPKLDALRRRTVAESLRPVPGGMTACTELLAQAWSELFRSCHRAWLGLASAWAVILVLNLTPAPTGASTAVLESRPSLSPETRLALAWQARLRAELLGYDPRPTAPARRPPAPAPRSEAVPTRGFA